MSADFADTGASTLIFVRGFLKKEIFSLAIERWRGHLCRKPVLFLVGNNGDHDSLLSARRAIKVRLSSKPSFVWERA